MKEQLEIFTRINSNGQEIMKFTLPWASGEIPQMTIKNNFLDTTIDCFLAAQTGRLSNGITDVSVKGKTLEVECSAFAINAPYVLSINGTEYTGADVKTIHTEWVDLFEAHESGEVMYRLYSPAGVQGKRPLILFLHGGGESGFDNIRQLTGCFGPAYLAETYRDCYVMAPQAPGHVPTEDELKTFLAQTYAASDQSTEEGWCRRYLSQVCDIIREMIADGRVDGDRVYVTGLSMGGAGTIRAMNIASDLFAAAVPCCPSMTPETFRILSNMTHQKVWVAASYIDHTLYRHKYLVDAVMKLKDDGNADAHLTLYSPEELQAYGIGIIEDMPLKALFGWNHMCWVPTYHNEHGIMSWLLNQHK